MLDASVDLIKNRLYLTVGRARKDQVAHSVEFIEEKIKELSLGFTCVTRFIDIREISDADVNAIAAVQGLLAHYGLAHAVRVGLEQGIELLGRVGKNVSYITTSARSVKQADEILDAWETTGKLPEGS